MAIAKEAEKIEEPVAEDTAIETDEPDELPETRLTPTEELTLTLSLSNFKN